MFYIDGVRHSAVVLAGDGREVVKLAASSSTGSKADPRVLYRYVGAWEAPEAHELALPKGYTVVRKTGPARKGSHS